MSRLTKGLLPVFVLGILATLGQAGTFICTETDSGQTAGDYGVLQQGGCVNSIPGSSPVLLVASDGESYFDPFDAGYDTSEGIQLNSNWLPDPAYEAAFAPGFWTEIPGTPNWVLPATNSCGIEGNESTCEPIAKWYFPNAIWEPGDTLYMLEADGITISDTIWLDNTGGPNGLDAAITFQSLDQSGVPEPGTLTLLGLGLGFAAVAKRLRKKSA